MKSNKGIIYKVTCLINNKIYIGKTLYSLNKRKNDHISCSAKNDTYFHKAISKYNPNNFSWEIIEENDKEKLPKREQYWIKKFNSFGEGYNLTYGGDGNLGWIPSEETKIKMREANSGENSPWYNKKHTPEQIDKIKNSIKLWWETIPNEILEKRNKNISISRKGKPLTEEHRKNIAKANKGNIVIISPEQKIIMSKRKKEWYKTHKNPMFGRKHSEKTKKRMKIKAKQRIILRDCNGRFLSNPKQLERQLEIAK